jgi:hypothetical protein
MHDALEGGINLGLKVGIADQIDDPTFGRFLIHGQFLSQRLSIRSYCECGSNSQKDKDTSFLHEECGLFAKEKVCPQDTFAFSQFNLCLVKIKHDA